MQYTPVLESEQARQLANSDHFLDFDESNRHFLPVWDISTFKRSIYTILHAECNPRQCQRRNKPDSWQIANVSSILTKTVRHFQPV
jgi:hypothetical protein